MNYFWGEDVAQDIESEIADAEAIYALTKEPTIWGYWARRYINSIDVPSALSRASFPGSAPHDEPMFIRATIHPMTTVTVE